MWFCCLYGVAVLWCSGVHAVVSWCYGVHAVWCWCEYDVMVLWSYLAQDHRAPVCYGVMVLSHGVSVYMRVGVGVWACGCVPGATLRHCNALQRTATHCNTLQHTATHCNTLQLTATHCNTLQHIATHCNTLQLTATHCNTR